jgi:hypothetical protein
MNTIGRCRIENVETLIGDDSNLCKNVLLSKILIMTLVFKYLRQCVRVHFIY